MGQALVKSIEFRVDPKTLAGIRGREAGQVPDGARPMDDKVPVELLSAAAGIADVDLRRAFLGAATSCVRRLEEILVLKSEIRNPKSEIQSHAYHRIRR